jgi:hypothetical protein
MMPQLPECERQRTESLRGLIAKMDETRADKLEAIVNDRIAQLDVTTRRAIAAEARVAELEGELAYRKNNFEQSCLWPSTIIESDQRMPDGRPTKLAVVPNWCIHKIECNARIPKP